MNHLIVILNKHQLCTDHSEVSSCNLNLHVSDGETIFLLTVSDSEGESAKVTGLLFLFLCPPLLSGLGPVHLTLLEDQQIVTFSNIIF